MNVTSLLALEQEAVRVGSSAEAMDAGLSKFAENLEQWRAGRGAIVEAMKNQQPEIIKFYKSLQGKDTQTAIPMVIEEMKQLREYADKKMMTDALGLDPAVARMTNEELDELRAKIPKLTDDQIKAGVASQIAWFKIREGMHNVSMEIGGRLAPAMTAIYESVARFIEGPAREWIEWSADYVQKNPEVVKAIGLIGGAFIAAAAGAALFALTLSPISVAIASIAAGAVLINEAFKHWDERKGRHAEDMGLQGPEALPEGKSATGMLLDKAKGFFSGVPKHAAGGVVTKPQVGMIGEAGPEAIIPLGKMDFGTETTAKLILFCALRMEEMWKNFFTNGGQGPGSAKGG
jgi:hypothetical protein